MGLLGFDLSALDDRSPGGSLLADDLPECARRNDPDVESLVFKLGLHGRCAEDAADLCCELCDHGRGGALGGKQSVP